MKKALLAAATGLAFTLSPSAQAERLKVNLVGYEEVPALSTPASGDFEAMITPEGDAIHWQFSYSATPTAVLQAHIHFGQMGVNGGISIFLCSNLPNPPAGTQACPQGPATIDGTARATDVIGPAGQGIAAGELQEVIAAIRNGTAYVNLHTQQFPGGEIRGQFRRTGKPTHDHK